MEATGSEIAEPTFVSQLLQASFLISGRAASSQSKAEFDSLRRRRNKVTGISPKGGWGHLPHAGGGAASGSPSDLTTRHPPSVSSPVSLLGGPGWGSSPVRTGRQFCLTPNRTLMSIPPEVLKLRDLKTPPHGSKASRTLRTLVHVDYICGG